MAKRSNIQPFQSNVQEDTLVCLRQRHAMTSRFDHEAADDRSLGAPPEKGQGLVHCWESEYDWRAVEELNSLRNLMTKIDEVDTGFAVWEEPELFSTGIKAVCRSLR